MKDFASLAHVRWECKYHVIFIPNTDGSDLWQAASGDRCDFRDCASRKGLVCWKAMR